MHRRALTTIGIALVLLTAGCLAGPSTTGGATHMTVGPQDVGRTISVSAGGQVEAPPDQAVVRVAVIARADNADAVREQLARNATQMREALRGIGTSDDQIRTLSFHIGEEFREGEKGHAPTGFQGFHAFEITVPNASRASTVIDTAVSNGADRVEHVELTLSEERRREVRANALREAMEVARGNADVIAESANLTIEGVHSVTTQDLDVVPVREETAQASGPGEPRTEIEPGPVTVTAQVHVTYNATV